MNILIKILKVIWKIAWAIIKINLKAVYLVAVFMFAGVFGTSKSNKQQYDAEYYGYE